MHFESQMTNRTITTIRTLIVYIEDNKQHLIDVINRSQLNFDLKKTSYKAFIWCEKYWTSDTVSGVSTD